MNGLIKALANALALGPIVTLITEIARSDHQRKARLLSQIQLGRFGEANDIVIDIRFLLSDAANFITVQIVPVDGGVTAV